MNGERIAFHVGGMTCTHCERAVEAAVNAVPGVIRATARLRGGRLEVECRRGCVDPAAIRAAIEGAGYTASERRDSASLAALGVGALLAALYLVANAAGLFNGLPSIDPSLGYGMLFAAGLLTSVHCVAMCGGIALSQSVRAGGIGAGGEGQAAADCPSAARREAGDDSTRGFLARLRPGLLYNGGRLFSYTLVGGLAGALGAAFGFSPTVKGLIAGAAGLFMLALGLGTLGLVPAIPGRSRLLPPSLGALFGNVARKLGGRGSFVVGMLNGLMPCGPLQTMQIYALGTGGLLAGAFSMAVFAAGTIPIMLTFGLVAATLPRKVLPHLVRASAVLVLLLGVLTMGRAASLAGIALPEPSATGLPPLLGPSSDGPGDAPGAKRASLPGGQLRAAIEGGVQTVTTDFGPGNYIPFMVQAGVPVRWTIRIAADDINGCNNPVVVPSLGLRIELEPGDNFVEFTPSKAGTIAYGCWMGMIRSRITVVDDPGSADAGAATAYAEALSVPDAAGSGLGSCCSGGVDPVFAAGRVPVDEIGLPEIVDGVQVVNVKVDSRGFSPAAIVLQRGMKAVITFDPVELTGCNGSVSFPEYSGRLDLSDGRSSTPAIPVDEDFTFQCWMGMLHGYVKVVDDLAALDLDEVRKEIGAYRAPGDGCCGSGGLSGFIPDDGTDAAPEASGEVGESS